MRVRIVTVILILLIVSGLFSITYLIGDITKKAIDISTRTGTLSVQLDDLSQRADTLNQSPIFKDDGTAEIIIEELNLAIEGIIDAPRFFIIYDVTVTAYTLEDGTGDGFTATMTIPEIGRTVAIDKEVIALGSEIFVPDIGWFTAEDVGGKVIGNHIDIYYGSGDEASKLAFDFGRQKIDKIYVFKEQ